jgi:hypothetical protein
MRNLFFLLHMAAVVPLFAGDDPCAQPTPEEMAATAGVTLPKLPWHVANIWWDFHKPATWFHCRVKDHAKPDTVFEVGSLRFEGEDFSFWARHSAFVEVYSTALDAW